MNSVSQDLSARALYSDHLLKRQKGIKWLKVLRVFWVKSTNEIFQSHTPFVSYWCDTTYRNQANPGVIRVGSRLGCSQLRAFSVVANLFLEGQALSATFFYEGQGCEYFQLCKILSIELLN